MKTAWIMLAALCAAAPAFAASQLSLPAESTPATPLPSDLPLSSLTPSTKALPAGTSIEIELSDAIASSRQHRGDKFGIRVAEDVLLDGAVLIPAGTMGIGEVVHAAPSGGGGKAGELILAARSLDLHGRTVALRGMKLGRSGKNMSKRSIELSIAVGLFAMFMHGGEVEIPAGTLAHAKLVADLSPETPPTEVTFTQVMVSSSSNRADALDVDTTASPEPSLSNQE